MALNDGLYIYMWRKAVSSIPAFSEESKEKREDMWSPVKHLNQELPQYREQWTFIVRD
jgi:hypothetical protein